MAGILVGYCRTSSADQQAGLEAQERDLKAAGVEKLFTEQVSSVAKRDRLEAAIDFCREGDTLMVTRPDRLSSRRRRSLEHHRAPRKEGRRASHPELRRRRRARYVQRNIEADPDHTGRDGSLGACRDVGAAA